MPVYTFKCFPCVVEEDVIRTVDKRNDPLICSCGKKMKRVPERFIPDVFEEYFDEGLNSDVYSRRHRKAIMDAQGVIEAGDAVHGGRNFDAKLPHLVDKQPPKGKVWKPAPSRTEATVTTIDEQGKAKDVFNIDDLPNAGQGLNNGT